VITSNDIGKPVVIRGQLVEANEESGTVKLQNGALRAFSVDNIEPFVVSPAFIEAARYAKQFVENGSVKTAPVAAESHIRGLVQIILDIAEGK